MGLSDQQQTQKPEPLVVKTEAPLESMITQHMFSAFMWAVTERISAERIDPQRSTTIVRTNGFRIDDTESLKSLRLQNHALLEIASDIQRTGQGTLQEVYMCVIPPLSCN